MYSLRLLFGVAAIPVLAIYTLAVVGQQRAPHATPTCASAANTGEPLLPVQTPGDTAADKGIAPGGE